MYNKNLQKWLNIIIPVIVTLITFFFTSFFSTKDNDNQIGQNYVELAISILKESPKDKLKYNEKELTIRNWAIKVLNSYSEDELKLSKEEQKILLENPIYLSGVRCEDGTYAATIQGCKECDSLKNNSK